MDKISIIIPAAGFKSRIKRGIPICNVEIGKKNLLDRQISCIEHCMSDYDYEIIVVGGFKSEKIKIPPNKTKLVVNEDFLTTNVGTSLRIGCEHITGDSLLIIYGDLFLGINFLKYDFKHSCLFFNRKNKNSIGGTINDGHVNNLFYGLSPNWSQVAYFKGSEFEIFTSLIQSKKYDKSFTFEIINDIIDYGGLFTPFITGKKCFDVDSNKDIKRLKKYICRN